MRARGPVRRSPGCLLTRLCLHHAAREAPAHELVRIARRRLSVKRIFTGRLSLSPSLARSLALYLSVHISTSHISARACGGPCDLLWLGVMYFNALDNPSVTSSRKNAADPLVSANARLKPGGGLFTACGPARPVNGFNQSTCCLHRVACRCLCH